MLHSENMWMLLASCENLLMLKIMHDAGYNVSDMCDFVVGSEQEYGSGEAIFYESVMKIFGTYEDLGEDDDDPYYIQRIWVPSRQLEVLLQHLDERFVRKNIEPYFHGASDYDSSEMIINIDESKRGFTMEMYENTGSCAGFIRTLLSLRKKLDQLSTLVIEKPKGEKSYALLYCSV